LETEAQPKRKKAMEKTEKNFARMFIVEFWQNG
jgi:hypothetical protein